MNPVILYRDGIDWRQESEIAKKYFHCYSLRPKIQKNDLVIGRFSALPFYKEQENEYKYVEACMINSYQDHIYIADLREWYNDLFHVTPKTWFKLHEIPEEGPFVLKGITNSKKFQWNTHMFAKNKKEAIDIHTRLITDSMLQYQDIIIRKYIPLFKYMDGLQGLPITKEFRFFCYRDKILSGGFYWSSHILDLHDIGVKPNIKEVPKNWLQKIVNIVAENTCFFVIDVAQTKSGDWIVIELNDGQMSGLSENDPNILYSNLKKALSKEGHESCN